MEIRDYLAGVKPHSKHYREVNARKQLLRSLITEIEKETKVEYPLTYVYYPMIKEGPGMNRGVTQEILVNRYPPLLRTAVFISGFTLLRFDDELVLGVLVEEFLHYAYRMRLVMNGLPIIQIEDKQMLEPISDWFTDSRFREAYDGAQAPPKLEEYEENMAAWTRDGRPVRDVSELPKHGLQMTAVKYDVRGDLLKAMMDRGKMKAPESEKEP
jgi:hypothetical protein